MKDKPADDKKSQETQALLAGEFASQEELEKHYLDLKKRVGDRDTELQEMRKQAEQAQALQQQIAQYQQAVQQMQPAYQWLVENQNQLRQYLSQSQNAPTAQQDTVGVLTPEEVQQINQQIYGKLKDELIDPWRQQFEQSAKQFTDQLRAEAQAREQANTSVMWETLKRFMPEDKVQEAIQWHERSLKYTDPKSFDPMELASDLISKETENASLKSQLEELRKQQEEAERAQLASVGSGATSLFSAPEAEELPKEPGAVKETVFTKLQEQYGPAWVQALRG